MPDMIRFNVIIERFVKIDDGNIDEIASAFDEVCKSYISISEFDPKTQSLKYSVFSVSEVEFIISDAKKVLSALNDIKLKIRDVVKDIGIMMPLSEIRKMAS